MFISRSDVEECTRYGWNNCKCCYEVIAETPEVPYDIPEITSEVTAEVVEEVEMEITEVVAEVGAGTSGETVRVLNTIN